MVETILDWRLYRYFTAEMEQASVWSSLLATYRLEPLPDGGGTRLHFRAQLQKAPAMRLARPVIRMGLSRKLKQDFERMAALMAKEIISLESHPAESSEIADLREV